MRQACIRRLRVGIALALVFVAAVPSFAQLTATWTSRGNVPKLPDGPGHRAWLKTIYDPVRKKVVVFGGSSRYFNDIWYYDTRDNRWTQIEPWICPVVFDFTPPLGRDDFGFAYDYGNDLYWLHGGGGYKCNQGTLTGVAQPGSSELTLMMGSEIPRQVDDFYKDFTVKVAGKKIYVVSYDRATHTAVLNARTLALQSGAAFGIYPQRGGGTYFYDPPAGEWTGFEGPYWNYPGPNPPSRKGGGFEYSTVDRVLVLFGGIAGVTDTWVMDTEMKRWSRVIPNGTANAPLARSEIANAMVYDRKQDVFVLFGGKCLDKRCVSGRSLSDTWVYSFSTNTWTQMSPLLSPPRRYVHNMAYDHVNEVTVLFGGRNESGVHYNDLWVYDHARNRWTEIPSAAKPSARRLSTFAYDEDRNLFVLYGGSGPNGGLRDLWILTLQ